MFDRRKRSGIMLCYPLEERRLRWWFEGHARSNSPKTDFVICQPKYDGWRTRLLYNPTYKPHTFPHGETVDPQDARLYTSTALELLSVPTLNQRLYYFLLGHGITWPLELDGEAYCHGLNFGQIESILATETHIHPDHEMIGFHNFDLFSHQHQAGRIAQLIDRIRVSEAENFYLRAPIDVATTLEEIFYLYEKYTDQGYEGIIVRHPLGFMMRRRSTFVMKFKPKAQDVYRIIGWVQEKDKYGNLKPSIGSFIARDDMGESFTVGSGLNEQGKHLDRRRWYQWMMDHGYRGGLCTLAGLQVVVNYQHLTPGRGVPLFPVVHNILMDGATFKF
jgi:hypothetical protein